MDPEILPEMSAKVGFLSRPLAPGEEKPRSMVSSSAVVLSEQETFVFVVRGERAEKVAVRIGERFGDMVAVLGGAQAGDTVVADPPQELSDGRRISIVEE